MKIKILKNIFVAVISVFLITSVTVFLALYLYYSELSKQELAETAEYISSAVELNGVEYLQRVDSKKVAGLELVKDGKVIYTLGQPQKGAMVHSTETSEGTLFVSGYKKTVATLLVSLFYQTVLILAGAIILSVFIASRIAKSITEPINEINIEDPSDRDIYPELKPFVRKISSQNIKIRRQVVELKDEHAKQERLRREFTANVSHELKTPLTSISGTAEIIRDGLVKTEDIPHFADNIHKESARLMALVEDIIKLSRLEEGEKAPEKTLVSLKELSEGIASRLEISARKQEVSILVSGDEGRIATDERICEEIVFNLLDNAVKYNKIGGSVKAEIEELSDSVKLTVSDTGIGIPKSELNRIFERFYRIDKSRSKSVGGTGLGLSIVKHGANYLGATIEVESKVGEGTRFSLTFPR